MPTTGKTLIIPPILIKACSAIQMLTPKAANLEKLSADLFAITKPRQINIKKE